MIAAIAGFELGGQLRSRVFPIVFAVSTLMVLGATAIDALRVGLPAEGALLGAGYVIRVHLVWSLFYLFTAAAFAADAVLRDEQAGLAPIIRATPARPAAYLLGRFLGGFGATALCFLSVPLALATAGFMPWLRGPGGPAPAPFGANLYGFLVLALPNLLVSSALFFGLATATRSMTGCLLGAVALLTLYGLSDGTAGGSLLALAEPFGFAAVAQATDSWSTVRRDVDWPAMGQGILLGNRLLWLTVACAFVALGLLGLRRTRGVRQAERSAAQDSAPSSLPAGPLPQPRFDRRLPVAQFAARAALLLRQVLRSPAFVVLLLLGLANAGAGAWRAASGGAASGPVIVALIDAFRLAPVVVAIFFAGELLWLERERRIDGLLAATPLGGPALFLPKLLALAAVLFALALVTATAGAAAQLLAGGVPDLRAYLLWYVLPKSFDWLLVAVLALFCQALSPNKLAGWGYMVFFLIGSLALNRLGYTDPLYRYGGYPGAPLPPALSDAPGVAAYRLYWGAIAAALTVLACLRVSRRS